MAVFILKRGLLDEKNFSIGGKRRKDKRKAYELRQQRLNNGAGQQKNQANQTTSKLPGQSQPKKQTGNRQQDGIVGQQNQTDPNSQQNKKAGNTTAIVPVDKNNQPINQSESGSSNVPVNNNQSSGTNNFPVDKNNQNSGNNSGTTAIVPVNNPPEPKPEPKPEQPKNIPDRPVGPFPTGQQGTTGNVDWMALGKAAWKKAKPVRVGAAVLGGAALGASLLAANKIGKTVDQAMDDRVDDRLEENRRLRRLKQERRIYERQLR
jgi:hypothetical protein